MTAWTADELQRIGQAEELRVATVRPDGTLRPYVTIWVVRAGDDLYVRSAHGPGSRWFGRAQSRRVGRVRAGGVERDVTFGDAPAGVHPAIDAAYHAKYDRYGERIVRTVVGDQVAPLTLRLLPREDA
jgi:hypothetical protein